LVCWSSVRRADSHDLPLKLAGVAREIRDLAGIGPDGRLQRHSGLLQLSLERLHRGPGALHYGLDLRLLLGGQIQVPEHPLPGGRLRLRPQRGRARPSGLRECHRGGYAAQGRQSYISMIHKSIPQFNGFQPGGSAGGQFAAGDGFPGPALIL
jgi:hypothetical protein